MFGKVFRNFLALYVALQTVACLHVFFHEPSAVLLKPGGDPNPRSDFGLTLGHWNGSLIVGSPKSNFFGEVYNCPVSGISAKKIECTAIELNATSTPYTLDINPNQYFYLGGSIATTKDYIFTCAPLVIKNLTKPYDKNQTMDAVGSCFIYNGTSTPYKGPWERYMSGDDSITDRFEGGTGWTTLADEDNGYLFIAKTSVSGEINYLPISDPNTMITALSKDMNHLFFNGYWDVGYGITAGKFFSNETVYAISMQSKSMMTGKIVFIENKKIKTKRNNSFYISYQLQLIVNKRKKVYSIDNYVVGAMFGYALGSADLSQDGLSELLVGAPLQSEDENELEYGALHIYLGGDKTSLNNRKRIRTIIGAKQRGRFGTTIAASDIDGDNIPEVFVSAPYEDTGVVYVLSGHELKNLLADTSSTGVQVSKMRHTQRVTRGDLKYLGFSIQVVPDLDKNGCNELAIGAPGSASVLLLKCLQTINVTITSELKGTIVRIQDSNFTVNVCVKITYMAGSEVSGNIDVNTDVVGNAMIKNPSFKVDLSKKQEKYCENIVVGDLQAGETGEYVLTTKLKLEDATSLKSDFDKSWVKLSTYSKTERQLTVSRHCNIDEDCTPHISLHVLWLSKPDRNYSTKGIKNDHYGRNSYEVESSTSETVSIVVKNIGMITTADRCAGVKIEGALVTRAESCVSKPGYLECSTVNPFRPNDESTFDIVVDMSSISSSKEKLILTAALYENCDRKVGFITVETLVIDYLFDEAWKRVQVEGVKHERLITDIELLASRDNEINQKKSMFKDDQEFLITNDGTVTWENINVVIEVEYRPFISKISTGEKDCKFDGETPLTINCSLTLPPRTTTKIMASVEMAGKEIGDAFNHGQEINITSKMILLKSFSEQAEKIEKVLVTNIKLEEEISFKNKPMLIALVAMVIALLLLALVTFCLYKKGFFKRNKKKKLDVLRESVRRRSIRLASEKSSRHSQKTTSHGDGDDHMDIEVVEDSPFEDVPVSTKDDVVLIESQAEIHMEDKDNHK